MPTKQANHCWIGFGSYGLAFLLIGMDAKQAGSGERSDLEWGSPGRARQLCQEQSWTHVVRPQGTRQEGAYPPPTNKQSGGSQRVAASQDNDSAENARLAPRDGLDNFVRNEIGRT